MTISTEMTANSFGLFREARGIVRKEFNQVIRLTDNDWLDVLDVYAKVSKNQRLKEINDKLAITQTAH